jgi:hypothetical protein
MIGTVTAKDSVDSKSMDAVSDSEELYRAAKSTATVAKGKLQQNIGTDRKQADLVLGNRSGAGNAIGRISL